MKTQYLLNAFIVFLFFSINANAASYEDEINKLASSVASKIQNAGGKRIAVVDFTNIGGGTTKLGKFIAEELSIALAEKNNNTFQVIDRSHLQSIIKEHKLSETGFFDISTAKKLGEFASVDMLLTGSLTGSQDSIRMTVKLLNVETAEIISSEKGHIARTQFIADLQGVYATKEDQPSKTLKTKAPKEDSRPFDIITDDKVSYELNSCKRKGQEITCYMNIVNNGKDTIIKIFKESYIFDESGSEYGINSVTIADKSGTSPSYPIVSKRIIQGTNVKAYFVFQSVPEKVNTISLLDIYPRLKFRNIPILK